MTTEQTSISSIPIDVAKTPSGARHNVLRDKQVSGFFPPPGSRNVFCPSVALVVRGYGRPVVTCRWQFKWKCGNPSQDLPGITGRVGRRNLGSRRSGKHHGMVLEWRGGGVELSSQPLGSRQSNDPGDTLICSRLYTHARTGARALL